MTRELRWYQADARDAVYDEWKNGNTRTAVVLPTGAGKTDVISAVATEKARAGLRVLILAHRSELLDQCTERCGMHAPDIAVGRVQANRNVARRPITVAMSSTVQGAKRRARMPKPDVVIVDETHHAASPSYVKILEWAGCFDEVDPTPLMGVTATFTRGDKRGLGDVFQSVAYQQGTMWAIEQGFLVRPHGRVVVGEHVKLEDAKVRQGDFVASDLDELVAQDVGEIVRAWQEYAENRITAAFTPGVDSARELAAAFRAVGVPTGEVYGNTPHGERAGIYADLAAGRIRVLVNVMVATEGFDCPPISCVLMARPTKLPGLYAQVIGRGLRLSPETGKSDCLVLDVVGASRTLRLQTLVDLIPSASYDRLEIDLTPCETCGGFIGRRPDVAKAAFEQGMEPCDCPCPNCDGWISWGNPPAGWDGPVRCTCEDGAGGSDPDGGRRKLTGPARYAFVDLLGDVEAQDRDALNWLQTEGGVAFLAVGDRYVSIAQHYDRAKQPTNMWSAAHIAQYGTKGAELICEYVAFNHAKRLVEKWAREYTEAHELKLFPRLAPWRQARERASDGQIAMARKLGIESPESYTKGGISDRIDTVRASRQFDR